MNNSCADTPNPVSLACLSCHDETGGGGAAGAVQTGDGAVHRLVNPSNTTSDSDGLTQPNCVACHPGGGVKPGQWWQIGPNLSNDHPISLVYATTLAEDPDFNMPDDAATGWNDVKLFNGKVECPSCHNPHDPQYIPFLRKDNSGSELCLVCHSK